MNQELNVRIVIINTSIVNGAITFAHTVLFTFNVIASLLALDWLIFKLSYQVIHSNRVLPKRRCELHKGRVG